MKFIFGFLIFSSLTHASTHSLEQKWDEICRDYEAEVFTLLPEDRFPFKLFWSNFEKYIPHFTKKGECAKNLLKERYHFLSERIKNEKILANIINMSLQTPWTAMDKRGCLLPGPYCDSALMRVFQLKDATRLSLSVQQPFLNYLTAGRLQPVVEFAAMNCHGTAEFLAGSFLKNTILATIKDWNISVKSSCYNSVEEKWQKKSHTIEALNPLGGIIINMKHTGCRETDCGLAAEMIRSCAGNQANTFTLIEGMCIQCWEKKLEAIGYKRIRDSELKAGCILTQDDHSITVLRKTAEWCYYFESTTSFGAPLFRVAPCLELSLNFPYRYCRN